MNQWNYYNSQNLNYIEDQVKALKKKHPEAFTKRTEPEPETKETTSETKREIIDVLEEQLIILQNIQKLLEEQQKTKKFWNIF